MAEGARLESVFTRKGNVGSNPTLSAITLLSWSPKIRKLRDGGMLNSRPGLDWSRNLLRSEPTSGALLPTTYVAPAHGYAPAGGELEQVQFLLGHASVETTERYLGCKWRLSHAVNEHLALEDTGGWARPKARQPGYYSEM